MLSAENTYIISLPERKYDRLDLLTAQMDNYNLGYTVKEAVKHENGVKGLLLSMQNLFNECLSKGLQNVWVLEDDALFIEPVEYIEKSFAQVPSDFDLLYFGGYMPLTPKGLYTNNLIPIDIMYSTHSIIYSRRGMSVALDVIEDTLSKGYFRPYDQLLVNGIQKAGNCYCSFPMIMKQRSGYSDIEKKDVDYTKYHEEGFRERTVHLRAPSNG